MTDNEIMNELLKLEEAYNKQFGDKYDMWIRRFRDYALSDFSEAVESIIQTKERFPSLTTMYTALNVCHASIGGRDKPVIPYVHYKDDKGCSYCLWNSTGIENDPPDISYNHRGEPCRLDCIDKEHNSDDYNGL